ncbi:MAG: integration host factor [Candidatus Cloacimonadota bacterium]|nr:MAG: integration host factor [Candidatus Cloacimonadota bacterium]
MSREDFIEKIALEAGLSKKDAAASLNAVLDGITLALEKGEKVSFVGFGTFSVAHRNARTGINPKTGEKIQIAERNVPVFKAGKKLKDSVK